MKIPRIAVLGSANIDLVCRVPRLPKPGETVRARGVARYCGGKGANQAVAAARQGAEVRFYGSVGSDAFGKALLSGLEENGVDAAAVERLADCPSGTATIWVDDAGENSIVIAEGANGRIDPAYVDKHIDAIADADILLLQFEIPLETVSHTLRALPAHRPRVVLDPAPATALDGLPISRIACLTPNEAELRTLSNLTDIEEACQRLLRLGTETVVCTMGERGARLARRGTASMMIAPPAIQAVDSTAAGDAFSAALAVALARHGETHLAEAIRFACAAGALAATREGAWPSLPTAQETEDLLRGTG